MKSKGNQFYKVFNERASNSSGFSAVATGFRWVSTKGNGNAYGAYYWSSSQASEEFGYSFSLFAHDDQLVVIGPFGGNVVNFTSGNDYSYKNVGFSIRCVKNKPEAR